VDIKGAALACSSFLPKYSRSSEVDQNETKKWNGK
jgi:hypothetical protein